MQHMHMLSKLVPKLFEYDVTLCMLVHTVAGPVVTKWKRVDGMLSPKAFDSADAHPL